MLESRKHDVVYGIGVDTDDPASVQIASILQHQYRVSVSVFERCKSLGQYHNDIARLQPGDVHTTLGDDVICSSVGWDDAIARVVENDPNGIWWWSCSGNRQVIYPIVSRGWLDAAGKIFTDFFPFWYDDVWLREVAIVARNGEEVPRIGGAKLIDCPTRTTRMRDVLFWDDFYQATRPARVAEGQHIARKLGMDITKERAWEIASVFAANEEFRARAHEVEAAQGEQTGPTPEYIAAKKRAEIAMSKISEINVV